MLVYCSSSLKTHINGKRRTSHGSSSSSLSLAVYARTGVCVCVDLSRLYNDGLAKGKQLKNIICLEEEEDEEKRAAAGNIYCAAAGLDWTGLACSVLSTHYTIYTLSRDMMPYSLASDEFSLRDVVTHSLISSSSGFALHTES